VRFSHGISCWGVCILESIQFCTSSTRPFATPPIVSYAGFCVQKDKLTKAVDNFEHPFWDTVRDNAGRKSIEMRRQGFFGAAMLPMSELEYTGIVEKRTELEPRFKVRAGEPVLQVR